MKIVTVIPLKKGPLSEDLTYFTTHDVAPGNIVTVPLRSKKTLGLVIAVGDAMRAKSDIKEMDFNLKKILEVKDRSLFRAEYLESVLEISRYFATSKNNAVASLVPALFREEYDKIAQISEEAQKTKNTNQNSKKIKTEKLLFQAKAEDRISAYKTLIRESFAQKKSIFIVLPTERDIKNLHDSLSRGIEQFTFALHAGLPKKKIIEKFAKIMATEHGILILGTAPFLSIPRPDIGTIIVEHESSAGYKMIPKPHLDLRIFAELFASKINAKLILSDTLLRFETIARAEEEGLPPLHPMSFRVNFGGEIAIANRGEEQRETTGKAAPFKIFSEKSLAEIKHFVSRKKNVFIFSLRKGLATMTVCRDCSEIVTCDKCSAPLVLYHSEDGKKRMFVCHRCQREKRADIVCALCGSWNLIPLGIGTDTVVEEIKKQFSAMRAGEPKIKILKLDRESAGNAKGALKIVKEFEGSPGSILVGTEMALFYLNEEVPLSVIASFDSLWSIPNFKMSEKIIELILSILRNTEDKFIIQTKNTKDPSILALETGNLLSFVREELRERKNLGYPPYQRFIKVSHLGNKFEAEKARQMLREILKEYEPEIFSGFVAKLKGKYTTNALLKLEPKKWSLPGLLFGAKMDEALLQKLLALPRGFDVFVDPEDLL
jgi:primosomal protein N' (replication factor Y)